MDVRAGGAGVKKAAAYERVTAAAAAAAVEAAAVEAVVAAAAWPRRRWGRAPRRSCGGSGRRGMAEDPWQATRQQGKGMVQMTKAQGWRYADWGGDGQTGGRGTP